MSASGAISCRFWSEVEPSAVQVVKALTGRARPSTLKKMELAESAYHFDGFRLDGAWRAYPSGHSAAVWASCVALGLRYRKVMVPMLIFGVIAAWARMYGNYHWPTDVLHGAALGAVFGWFWGRSVCSQDRGEEALPSA
jgi:membrane-associated phospholipid phosphatase